MSVGSQRWDRARFYRGSAGECLFCISVSAGDRDMAQEFVAGACSSTPAQTALRNGSGSSGRRHPALGYDLVPERQQEGPL